MNKLTQIALALCAAHAVALAAPPAADKPPKGESPPPAAPAIRDPFRFSTPNDSHGLVPATGRQLPHGIRLLGTAIHENGTAVAALRLPGPESEIVFVEAEDVIRIDEKQVDANGRPTKGRQPSAQKTTTLTLYLLVQKISDKGVEVSPQQSPSEVHLIR